MIVVFFAGMIGTLLVLTLFLQFGEHFSAIHAGLTLAPFALGTAVGATLAGGACSSRGSGGPCCRSPAVIAGRRRVVAARRSIDAHGLRHQLAGAGRAAAACVGIGIGMMVSPLFDFILASVTDDEVGSASGVLNAMQQLAGAVGVAGDRDDVLHARSGTPGS